MSAASAAAPELSLLAATLDEAVARLPAAPRLYRIAGDLIAIRAGERAAGDLARLLGLTPSAVSHQLRLLRNLRLVRKRRVGRHAYYALDDDHVVQLLRQGLEHVRHG